MKGLRSPAARAVAEVLAEAREKAGLTQRQVTVPEFITLAKKVGADPLDLFRAVLKQS